MRSRAIMNQITGLLFGAIFLLGAGCAQLGLEKEKKSDDTMTLAAIALLASGSSGPAVTAQIEATASTGDGTYTITESGSSVSATSTTVNAMAAGTQLTYTAIIQGGVLYTELEEGTYTLSNLAGTVTFTITVVYNGDETWTVTIDAGTSGITFGTPTVTHSAWFEPSGFIGSCTNTSLSYGYCVNWYLSSSYATIDQLCTVGTASSEKCPAADSIGACTYTYSAYGISSGFDLVYYNDYATVSALKASCDSTGAAFSSSAGYRIQWTYAYRP